MKTVITCVALAWLSGCAVVPPDAWSFDPTRPAAKPVLPAEQLATLTDRVAELQLQRNAIRASIATQPDVWQRQNLYEQLHAVGMRLSPLERQLAGAASSR